MKLISIIVPIYNVEKTLEKCLLSIRNQTYQNIEIICVNDGSLDNSLEIIRKMMRFDSRILLIDKENGGLSSARNAGLEIAQGEYVGFIDSDDFVEIEMYQNLIDSIESDSSDLACCGTHLINEQYEEIKSPLSNYLKTPDKILSIRPELLLDINVYAWNKLYKKEIIKRFNIQFAEKLFYEDAAFLYMYLCHTNKISFISKKLYFYVQHRASIMGQTQTNKNLRSLDHIRILFPLWKHISRYDISINYIRVFLEISWKYIAAAFKYLPENKKVYIFKEGKELFKFIYDLELNVFKSRKLKFYLLVFYSFLMMFLRKIQKTIWGRKI